MKKYEYQKRIIVELDDKRRLSFSRERYGNLLDLTINQSIESGGKLFNPYRLLEEEAVELLYWDGNKEVSILVDKRDLERVKSKYWTLNHNGYVHSRSGGEKTYLHWYVIGERPSKGMVVDHINNNPLDNRKANLRLVSIRENNTNQINQEFKGVTRTQKGDGWRARWSLCGKDFSKSFYGEDSFELAKSYRLKMMKESGYLRTCND